jgi:hypothetical protein
MATKIVTETLICIGDTICTLLESVANNSLTAAPGVSITVIPPPGVTYASQNLAQGSFNALTNVWTIGTLVKGQNVAGNICWTVDDDCLAPFKFNFILQADSNHVCINAEEKEHCIVIGGITKCQLDTFKPIKTLDSAIASEFTLSITDYTVLVDAGANAVDINLPTPASVYKESVENPNKNGGKEYHIKVIDLANPVKLITPSGKIVDFSTVASAGTEYNFSLVGQTVLIHSDGTNYYVKTI